MKHLNNFRTILNPFFWLENKSSGDFRTSSATRRVNTEFAFYLIGSNGKYNGEESTVTRIGPSSSPHREDVWRVVQTRP